MSSTSKLKGPPGEDDATAIATAFLAKIDMHSILEQGVVRLLEEYPLPSSALAAWLVLAAEVTRVIQAQGVEEPKDVVAAMIAMFVETLVRILKAVWRRVVV